jgi:hypothetical protein
VCRTTRNSDRNCRDERLNITSEDLARGCRGKVLFCVSHLAELKHELDESGNSHRMIFSLQMTRGPCCTNSTVGFGQLSITIDRSRSWVLILSC